MGRGLGVSSAGIIPFPDPRSSGFHGGTRPPCCRGPGGTLSKQARPPQPRGRHVTHTDQSGSSLGI